MIPPSYEAVSARPRYSLYSVHKDFNLHSYFNYFIVPNQTSPNPPPSSFQLFLFKLKCIFFFFFLCYSLHSPYSKKLLFSPSLLLSFCNIIILSSYKQGQIYVFIFFFFGGGGIMGKNCAQHEKSYLFLNLKIQNLPPPLSQSLPKIGKEKGKAKDVKLMKHW